MDRNRLLVRHLPPDLSEQDFVQSFVEAGYLNDANVEKLNGIKSLDYFGGENSTSDKINKFSRAYIVFQDFKSRDLFIAKCQKFQFCRDEGVLYEAVVEPAPLQLDLLNKASKKQPILPIDQQPLYQGYLQSKLKSIEERKAEASKKPRTRKVTESVVTVGVKNQQKKRKPERKSAKLSKSTEPEKPKEESVKSGNQQKPKAKEKRRAKKKQPSNGELAKEPNTIQTVRTSINNLKITINKVKPAN